VKECVHKVTGRHCAVKIIDKATIEPGEKQLLRTEIAGDAMMMMMMVVMMMVMFDSVEAGAPSEHHPAGGHLREQDEHLHRDGDVEGRRTLPAHRGAAAVSDALASRM
jgi:hypothetical protein